MDAGTIIFIVVIFVIFGWLAAGAASNGSAPPVTSTPERREECKVCDKLDAWWTIQDWLGKIVGLPWYLLNKAACAIKGC
jgi:hypothetical protein